eukprot:COSAG03_NODE_898_length_5429_cov_1.947467_3_plen_185_part_00
MRLFGGATGATGAARDGFEDPSANEAQLSLVSRGASGSSRFFESSCGAEGPWAAVPCCGSLARCCRCCSRTVSSHRCCSASRCGRATASRRSTYSYGSSSSCTQRPRRPWRWTSPPSPAGHLRATRGISPSCSARTSSRSTACRLRRGLAARATGSSGWTASLTSARCDAPPYFPTPSRFPTQR